MNRNSKNTLFYAQALLGEKTGVGYYNEALLQQLLKSADKKTLVLIYFESFLSRKYTRLLKDKYPNIRLKAHRVLPLKIAQKLAGTYLEPSVDILWPLHYGNAIFPNFYGFHTGRNKRFIISIPDLAYIKYPEVLPNSRKGIFKNLLPSGPDFLLRVTHKQIPKADLILTISESVKKQLKDEFKLDKNKIIVTSLYPNYLTRGYSSNNSNLNGKYILFVGTVEPRKNIDTLLTGYENLPKSLRKTYKLVIAGKLGWKYESVANRIKLMQTSGYQIEVTGYISAEKKRILYENASLYVQPSIYEGFGMPILEAMFYKVPVVCSDIDVFREVAGFGGAVFFETHSGLSLSKAIVNVLGDTNIQEELVKQGLKRIGKYKRDEDGINELINKLY